ncbi:MAG: hypothetical protein IPK83_03435 [Planctomycetes bacterium]|nr:hypothetical protein [Planctomycetota bacterium]
MTLTVTDEFGNQHVYHQTISVQGFSGTTYYVSSSGSDSNNGTSPSTPFSTVQKGLSVLSSGKRLLLNKGDTFSAGNVDLPSNSQLGAYGSGALPIINGNISPDSTTTVMDIRLDCGGASAFIDVWNITDLLVLRVTMVNTDHGAGDWYGNRLFLVDSTITNAALVSIFTDCNRLALLGNMFDRAINSHNLYLGVNRGVVSANNVWKPSTSGSGRHCMRIAASPVNPAFLTITDNDFDGSTTWCAIQFRSSSGTYEPNAHMDNLLFERNIVRSNSDTKLILCMGDYLNTTIRSNNFSNASPPGGFTTFEIEPHSDPGYSGHDGPRGVWFHDNTITNNGATWFSNTSPDSQSVFVYENAVNGQFIAGNPPP